MGCSLWLNDRSSLDIYIFFFAAFMWSQYFKTSGVRVGLLDACKTKNWYKYCNVCTWDFCTSAYFWFTFSFSECVNGIFYILKTCFIICKAYLVYFRSFWHELNSIVTLNSILLHQSQNDDAPLQRASLSCLAVWVQWPLYHGCERSFVVYRGYLRSGRDVYMLH